MRRLALGIALGVGAMLGAPALGLPVKPLLPGLSTETTSSLSASPTVVTYPHTTRLTGRLLDGDGKPIAEQSVKVEVKKASSKTWVVATKRSTATDGTFIWDAKLSATSQLRATFDGDGIYGASTSKAITVQLRPVISFDDRKVMGQGQKARLGGTMSPAQSGRSVRLYYLSGKTWKSSGQSTTINGKGQWAIDVSYPTLGDRALRVELASGSDSLAATSVQRTVRVTYPFQTVVSTGGKARVDIVRTDAPGGGCTIGLGRILAGATKVQLHPGSADPGGSWRTPSSLPAGQRAGVVASFNSGFVLKSSRGGFLLEGQQPYAIKDGAASLMSVSDGTWRLGTMGRDFQVSRQTSSVRQNLELLVDGSKVLSTVDSDIQRRWGDTYGAVTNTWRSGIGIDPAGNLIYVMGQCLSPRQVAQSLVNGGAVRGMELDVNVYWPAFEYYTASDAKSQTLTPHTLLPNEHNPADHYFRNSERDFFSVRLR